MKNGAIVWRTLADAALEGRRDWNSIGGIADAMVSTILSAAQQLVDDVEVTYALSGSSAAVHYLVGRNTVADLGRRIVHKTRPLSQADFPEGDEVIILAEDPLAALTWTFGYASLAQTHSDLWASPGWQAADKGRAETQGRGKKIMGERADTARSTSARNTSAPVGAAASLVNESTKQQSRSVLS